MAWPAVSWAQSKVSSWLARPFGRLCGHFLRALTQSGQESEQLEFGAGALLALLAVPGVFAALSLLDRYSTFLAWLRQQGPMDVYAVSMPDKYFFVVFSMAITGLVAVFKWDRILPSRQDYFNFAPLPVADRQIYLASLTAALAAAGLFALDVNLGSTLLFPLVVMASVPGASFSSFALFVLTHAFVVILASLFTFFACFAVMTLALALLPQSWFARVSVPLRVSLMVALLALLVSNAVAPALLRTRPASWLGWLPPAWFVGLYQQLQGSGPVGLAALAWRAWAGLAAAITLASGASWLAYHRYYRRIPEMSEGGAITARGAPGWWWRAFGWQGVAGFSVRVLLRSETHTLVVGALWGLGLLLATEAGLGALSRRPPRDGLPALGWLSVPLILTYLLVAAIRFSFELPAYWRANWIFAYLLDPRDHRAPAVARRILLATAAPLIFVAGLLFSLNWGMQIGLTYSAYLLVASAMLIELLVVDFRKVPFTCSLPPFRNDSLAVMLGHLLGFALFTAGGAQLASLMWRAPLKFAILSTLLSSFWAAGWYWLRESSTGATDLQFTARQEAALQTLDLSGRA
ncbi:MAG: hypothetical protein K2X03_15935 [Bryobacteraceae bacterium]|nr:hypothetical protein [Bryobacteraceae bacterium]